MIPSPMRLSLGDPRDYLQRIVVGFVETCKPCCWELFYKSTTLSMARLCFLPRSIHFYWT